VQHDVNLVLELVQLEVQPYVLELVQHVEEP
jgi:hypothetical protein